MSLPPLPASLLPAAATPPAERWLLPDVLRGLAILGILCVNMQDFAGYDEWLQRGPDRAAQLVIDVLFNGKFISLFAMLFGAGMQIIAQRAGGIRLLRRLLALLVLGGLHFVLLWSGDIITLYACLGLVLLPPLLARPPAWLLAVGGSGLCVWWLVLRVHDAVRVGALQGVTQAGQGERYSFVQDLLPGTPWTDLIQSRAHSLFSTVGGGLDYNFQWLAGLLLLGMAAQRAGLLAHPERFRPLLKGLLVLGLLLGLPLSALLAWLNTQNTSAAGFWEVPVRLAGGLLTGLGYAGVAGLLVAAGNIGWLRLFAAPGRLAFSNYLAQSLVMTAVFYPYGLKLYRHLGALPCLLLALALGAAQLWLSGLWLRRFRQGPAEGLLRGLVYGRRTRM